MGFVWARLCLVPPVSVPVRPHPDVGSFQGSETGEPSCPPGVLCCLSFAKSVVCRVDGEAPLTAEATPSLLGSGGRKAVGPTKRSKHCYLVTAQPAQCLALSFRSTMQFCIFGPLSGRKI